MEKQEIKLPLKVEQEEIAHQVWYVKDADGVKLAICNEYCARMFANAVNRLADLKQCLIEKDEEIAALQDQLENMLFKLRSYELEAATQATTSPLPSQIEDLADHG